MREGWAARPDSLTGRVRLPYLQRHQAAILRRPAAAAFRQAKIAQTSTAAWRASYAILAYLEAEVGKNTPWTWRLCPRPPRQ
jgi:hypothetical protein